MSYLNFIALILLFLISIFGIIGNFLLIRVFRRGKLTHFNGLTVALAIFDNLTICGLIINAIYSEILLPKDFHYPWEDSNITGKYESHFQK